MSELWSSGTAFWFSEIRGLVCIFLKFWGRGLQFDRFYNYSKLLLLIWDEKKQTNGLDFKISGYLFLFLSRHQRQYSIRCTTDHPHRRQNPATYTSWKTPLAVGWWQRTLTTHWFWFFFLSSSFVTECDELKAKVSCMLSIGSVNIDFRVSNPEN